MSRDPELVGEMSRSGLCRAAYELTSPFRGYGIERVPGLRPTYQRLWRHFAPRGLREIRLGDATLLVDFADMSIVPSLWITRRYEATFSRALDSLVQPGHNLVDVGAHVGYYAVRFAKRVGPRGQVIAYEPEQSLSRILDINLARNGVTGWATTHRKAVGSANRTAKLWLNGSNTGGASLSRAAVDGTVRGSQEVEVVSLDYHLREEVDFQAPVHLIKIDVQGHEASVVEGATKTVERDRPVLAFEYNPSQIVAAGGDPTQLLADLANSEYRFCLASEHDGTVRRVGGAALHDWVIHEKRDGTGFANVIALHESNPSLPSHSRRA